MQVPKSPERTLRVRKTESKPDRQMVVFDTEPKQRTRVVKKKQETRLNSSLESKFNEEQPQEESADDEYEIFQPKENNSVKKTNKSSYPDLINKMLVLCVNEKDYIKGTCAGRIKSHYQTVFQSYKAKMDPRDRAIVNSGLNYIYNFSRVNSIPKENANWLISINEIPISHIVSYTSKDILKDIAKQYGIPCSNKKAEELVASIREVVEKN